jgi:hypothetical protein
MGQGDPGSQHQALKINPPWFNIPYHPFGESTSATASCACEQRLTASTFHVTHHARPEQQQLLEVSAANRPGDRQR